MEDVVKQYFPKVTFGEGIRPAADSELIQHSPTTRLGNESSARFFTTTAIANSAEMPNFDRFVLQGHPVVRLAGLSGAAAVALGAYGAHAFAGKEEKQEMKKVYDTANFYHFMHTVALVGVPLSRRPILTGSLMVGGMTIFCGTIYYHALTEEKHLRKYTPYGGVLLILAWLSLAI